MLKDILQLLSAVAIVCLVATVSLILFVKAVERCTQIQRWRVGEMWAEFNCWWRTAEYRCQRSTGFFAVLVSFLRFKVVRAFLRLKGGHWIGELDRAIVLLLCILVSALIAITGWNVLAKLVDLIQGKF